MQNTRTNELETGRLDELYHRIPPKDRGPIFREGEVIKIKGYYYRVEATEKNRLVFSPHGPTKDGMKQHPKDQLRERAAEVQNEIGRLDERGL